MIGLCAVIVAAAFAASGELGFSRSVTPGLITHLERRFGHGVRVRLEGWKEFVRSTAGRAGQARGNSADAELLPPVNRFFNRLPPGTDRALWGVDDYWATPSEALAVNGADCEDYALAKYFTLKELGVPVGRLRMVYARTWQSSEPHMVLAYYSDPQADPLILDNLQAGISPASARHDLTPVFTFNDDDVSLVREGLPEIRGDVSSNWTWRELLGRLERELTY